MPTYCHDKAISQIKTRCKIKTISEIINSTLGEGQMQICSHDSLLAGSMPDEHPHLETWVGLQLSYVTRMLDGRLGSMRNPRHCQVHAGTADCFFNGCFHRQASIQLSMHTAFSQFPPPLPPSPIPPPPFQSSLGRSLQKKHAEGWHGAGEAGDRPPPFLTLFAS